jgi:hypothetical protein
MQDRKLASLLTDDAQARCARAPPERALTETEINLLDALVRPCANRSPAERSLSEYLLKLAKLGGYLARAGDPPPGNLVMWRGLSRLTDIHLGFLLAKGGVGN